MAPETFERAGRKSAVVKQPEEGLAARAALRAMTACPTGSIRSEEPELSLGRLLRDPSFLLEPVDEDSLPGVFHTGFHSHRSFGATPYLLVLPGDERHGVLVDAPRFSTRLLKAVEALCEPRHLVLTHVDDVGDHQKWRDAWPQLRRVLHVKEIYGPGNWLGDRDLETCEVQLEGKGPWDLDGRALTPADGGRGPWLQHLPGHSEGSVALCWRREAEAFAGSAIFTGDSLAMSGPKPEQGREQGATTGFPRYNSAGRGLQAQSLRQLARECGAFQWTLPGHGRRFESGSADAFEDYVEAAARELESWGH